MLSPAKAALIKLHFNEDLADGAVLLEMVLDDHGEAPACMDVELGRLTADQPASISLFNLRAQESPIFPVTLAGRLTFDPLNNIMEMITNGFSFWGGAELKLRKEAERRRKKAAAAAKRRARRGGGAGAAQARARPVARALQRPPGAGLLVQLEDAPAPLADDAGLGQAPVQLRLLADEDGDDDGHGVELCFQDDVPQVDEVLGGDWNQHAGNDEADPADGGGNTQATYE